MKIVRSWPEVVPENRCYVVDTLPKLIMKDYDYRCLGDLDDDVLLIEWDMAVSKEHLELFIEQIREDPDRVLVAPYKVYQPTTGARNLPRGPQWVCRRYTDETTYGMYFIEEFEPTCHLFGLGMTYLPRRVIKAFLNAYPGHFSDGSFSGWHYRNIEQETRIAWDVRPIHLHYLIERTPS